MPGCHWDALGARHVSEFGMVVEHGPGMPICSMEYLPTLALKIAQM